jgi:hypothetical protein
MKAINSPLTIFVFTPLTAVFADGVGSFGEIYDFVGVFSSWGGGLTAAAQDMRELAPPPQPACWP